MPDIPQREKNSILKSMEKKNKDVTYESEIFMNSFIEDNVKKQQNEVIKEQSQNEEEQSNIIIRFFKILYNIITGQSKKQQKVNTVEVKHDDAIKEYNEQLQQKELEQEKANKK